nr:hypothetical protein [Tanacetum cinerariifolium]
MHHFKTFVVIFKVVHAKNQRPRLAKKAIVLLSLGTYMMKNISFYAKCYLTLFALKR